MFSYVVSQLVKRHPDSYIHVVESRVTGNVDRGAKAGEVRIFGHLIICRAKTSCGTFRSRARISPQAATLATRRSEMRTSMEISSRSAAHTSQTSVYYYLGVYALILHKSARSATPPSKGPSDCEGQSRLVLHPEEPQGYIDYPSSDPTAGL